MEVHKSMREYTNVFIGKKQLSVAKRYRKSHYHTCLVQEERKKEAGINDRNQFTIIEKLRARSKEVVQAPEHFDEVKDGNLRI